MRGIHLFEGEKPASQLAVRAGDGNLVGLQLQLDAVEDEVVPEVRAAHEEPLVVHDLDRSYNDATDFLHFENDFQNIVWICSLEIQNIFPNCREFQYLKANIITTPGFLVDALI